MNQRPALAHIREWIKRNIASQDAQLFQEHIKRELLAMHEGRIAGLRLKPTEFEECQKNLECLIGFAIVELVAKSRRCDVLTVDLTRDIEFGSQYYLWVVLNQFVFLMYGRLRACRVYRHRGFEDEFAVFDDCDFAAVKGGSAIGGLGGSSQCGFDAIQIRFRTGRFRLSR